MAVADTVLTREFMRPGLKELRNITTEQYRLSWHNEQMRQSVQAAQISVADQIREQKPELGTAQARGIMFIAFARGVGTLLLADLHPGAWELPFDVVAIPLYEQS